MADFWARTVAEDNVKVVLPRDSFWKKEKARGKGDFLAQDRGGEWLL